MNSEVFFIKSLMIQNTIMVIALGVVVLLLLRAAVKRQPKHLLVFAVWVGIVFWFFNSPFFGFSKVTVDEGGIGVEYGILSFRNSRLPVDTSWEITTTMSGIRKMRRLYFIEIGRHHSMKVRGVEGLTLLKEVGRAIEAVKSGEKPSQGSAPGSAAADGAGTSGFFAIARG